jgi:dihydrodipicolinate synthase/N-acetylneuraminate lyase
MSLPPAVLAAGFKLVTSRRFKGPPARMKPAHHLLKEALRLQGHPITPKVRRPFAEATPAESELVARSLRELDWL